MSHLRASILLGGCLFWTACSNAPPSTSGEPVATSASAAPFVGTWLLDTKASTLSGMRMVFAGDAYGEMEMAINGTTHRFRLDGKEYDAYGTKATWRKTGERTWQTVYRVNGQVNNTDEFTLSADGRTLSMTTDRVGPPPSQERYEFTRAAASADLIGDWRGSMSLGDGVGMVIADAVGTRVHVRMLPQPAEAHLDTDGTLAPVEGPSGLSPDGMMVGFQVTGPRTFSMIQQLKEQPLMTSTYTLSEDGRTLEGDAPAGPDPAASERLHFVYRREPEP